MQKRKIKFAVLAGLCLLLTLPILRYVQTQSDAALRAATDGRMSGREQDQRWQRRALREWLQRNLGAAGLPASGSDRRVIVVALPPGTTQPQLLGQARRVRQILRTYFRDGSAGAVTAVILSADGARDAVSVRTGLGDTPTQRDRAWHILVGSQAVE